MPSGVYKRTEEHKRKLGRIMSSILSGRTMPEEQKIQIRNTLLGRKFTAERKANMSKAMKGIKRSKKFKDWLSMYMSGSNHWNWQGGKSYEIYPLGWNRTYKEQIRRRDEYKCVRCQVPEVEMREKLSVHHIDLNKQNISSDNLISICRSCHTKLHREIKRKLVVQDISFYGDSLKW